MMSILDTYLRKILTPMFNYKFYNYNNVNYVSIFYVSKLFIYFLNGVSKYIIYYGTKII